MIKTELGPDIISTYKPYQRSKNGADWKITTVQGMAIELPSYYEIQGIIGKGAQGTVFLAKDTQADKTVAIKHMDKAFEHKILAKRTLREIKLLKLLQHENVLSVESIILPRSRESFNEIYLVSEYMDSDLTTVIKSNDKFDEESLKFLMYQILRGLKYIHEAQVVHRDIKPRNILVNQEGLVKICDFGLARSILHELKVKTALTLTDYVITRWYRAPQVLLGQINYETSVDMWSAGCVFAQMLLKKPLLPGYDTKNQIQLIVDLMGTPEISTMNIPESSKQQILAFPQKKVGKITTLFQDLGPKPMDLLCRMLTFDPNKRITAADAILHPFFQDIHYEDEQPPRGTLNPIQFQFEYTQLTMEQLKDAIYEQILLYHFKDVCQVYETRLKEGKSLIEHIVKNSNRNIADDD